MSIFEKELYNLVKQTRLPVYSIRNHSAPKDRKAAILSQCEQQPSCQAALEYLASMYFENKIYMTDPVNIGELLTEAGFKEEEIQNTVQWIDKLYKSGSLSHAFSMLRPHRQNPRIFDAVETLTIPDTLLNKLQKLIAKGVINQDIYEQLMEALRTADPRDWEKEDIDDFVFDLIENVRQISGNHFADGLLNNKKAADLYL